MKQFFFMIFLKLADDMNLIHFDWPIFRLSIASQQLVVVFRVAAFSSVSQQYALGLLHFLCVKLLSREEDKEWKEIDTMLVSLMRL